MDTIPIEIHLLICSRFQQIDMLKYRLVSRYFNSIFIEWTNVNTISLSRNITDIILSLLQIIDYCDELNLSHCIKITDEGLQYLTNCSNLNLSYCNKITDEGLQYLTNCRL